MSREIPIIEITNVSKVYNKLGTRVDALRDVSFQIDKGEFVSIIGPSGSGKSTLLHILGALDNPTTGEYILDGNHVSSMSDDVVSKIRRTKIGFVFQVFNLIHQLDVLENVTLPLRYAGVESEVAIATAKQCIHRVGLSDRMLHTPSELSGGERQRAAIARALAIQPTVLLADEPTGNLDSETGETILSLFEELHNEGHTLIVVTHDASVAQRADRSIVLLDGLVVREESKV
jgi:putative ABC transport system ATP-binding protein